MGKSEARPKDHGGRDVGGSGSPGKIFVGGLPRDTTLATFQKHFGNYGVIVDSVIMKNKQTSQPRGFGFITYSDPAVVDKVMEDTHVINGKQAISSFFEKYGAVVEHQIMRDHQTRRSRGFGFVVFESEEVVDDLLANGNMIDLAGSKVEIKKAEPKKSSNLPTSTGSDSRSAYGRDCRDRPSGDDRGGLADAYSSYNSGELGGYEGMSSFGYPSRFGPYGGGLDGPYAAGNLRGYRRGGDESFGGPGSSSFGGAMYAGAYDPALGIYAPGCTPDMNRGSFAPGRHHPY
ncbi:hypothetical protein ZWY2020_028849 [Hordeum vulgare]|nr:hypothetical protein ZWY2020_028849 [Hordeum vulgare]